jgi:hypothetical protein
MELRVDGGAVLVEAQCWWRRSAGGGAVLVEAQADRGAVLTEVRA